MKKKAAMLQITKESKMKKIWKIVCILLVAMAMVGCKAKSKVDVKDVEKRLSAYVLHDLQVSGSNLLEFTLQEAPKGSEVTWIGVATYSYSYDGSDSQDVDISAKYLADTNSVTWWYTTNPYDPKTVPLTGDIVFEEPEYRMTYDAPYEEEAPIQPVSNSKNKQSTNSEPTVTLGKVEQKGSKFTLFDSNKREITYINMPGQDLVGWGNDFFVTVSGKNTSTFKTYNLRCTEIGSISVGANVVSATVDNEGFIVTKKGSSPEKYNKNAKRR
jgi:hypothetical protein